MKERHFQKKLDLSDHSDGNKGGLEEQDCEVTNTELIEYICIYIYIYRDTSRNIIMT